MKNLIYLIGLLLILNGCGWSWFDKEDPLKIQYELDKKDRAKPDKVKCDCDNPDKLSFGFPEIDKKEKGHVSISNPDYEVMADNQQARIKWQKEGRGYKRCVMRCLEEYNDYLDKLNAE